jgi:hypothetical protein
MKINALPHDLPYFSLRFQSFAQHHLAEQMGQILKKANIEISAAAVWTSGQIMNITDDSQLR